MTVKFTLYTKAGFKMDTRKVSDYAEIEAVRSELKSQQGVYAVDWH